LTGHSLSDDVAARRQDRPPQTLGEAIAAHAAARPDAPAIVFADLTAITYRALNEQVGRVGAVLEAAGIGAKNRVAISLQDGGHLAATIASVACHATVVLLNPNLTASEIDDLFVSHRLDAIVVPGGVDTPARVVAQRRGVCFLEATTDGSHISLAPATAPLSGDGAKAKPGLGDAVIILRTSGTTAQAKLVPMTHRYLGVMAAQRRHWFGLGASDRALAAAPVYYSQGSNVLLATLMLGGSLACPARAPGANFCDWLAELEPTWYSAGPTFHRSVLDQALARPKSTLRHKLRYIQCGAAPLPEAVQAGLESVFGVPVCEGYGMTETGNITANSIAPEGRREGTVGKAYGIELALCDDNGSFAARGGPAEVVVRGPGVTAGYLDRDAENRASFIDGWFHTGDVGVIDADGFLSLVGRVKEMINRGGEKIAPAEIDEALQRHPAVAEAASFPVPHPRLGEDVVAAAVLRPGAAATARELRRFLQPTLVSFKIPRRIHLVESLPKGETGKVLRQELSQRFAPRPGRPVLAGDFASPLEFEIASIWERLLDGKPVGPDDDFFEIGGDSILATQLLLELERLTGKSLPDTILFENATVGQLAESIVQTDAASEKSLILRLQPGKGERPFFFADGDFWGGGYYVRKIARLLGEEYPCYALRSHGLHGGAVPSIEEAAADYLALIRAVQPQGPYRLGGHCNGGLIALELARRLEAEGERVELVALVETISLNARQSLRLLGRGLETLCAGRAEWTAEAMLLSWRATRKAGRLAFERGPGVKPDDSLGAVAVRIEEEDQASARRYVALMRDYHRVMARYLPVPIAAPILCLVAQSHARSLDYAGAPWRNLAADVAIGVIPGEHSTCITAHADVLAQHIRQRLHALDRAAQPARDMVPAG
jgi:acyl-CoA synthetase (AMP-forming)/AMP-acid ligase II/thioesterase domain-containing protein/acyl carrier protein